MRQPVCPYCQNPAEYMASSSSLYANGKDYGPVWICHGCKAWVGCHKAEYGISAIPLGRLANAELRKAKIAAHTAFDRLWKSGKMSRGHAYRWLAERLGISSKVCHIGMFDVAMCRRVVEIVSSERAGKR